MLFFHTTYSLILCPASLAAPSLFLPVCQPHKQNPDMLKTIDTRIKFIAVCDKIKIDKCQFSDKEFCNCPIYCNKLEKVHEFYNKS